MDEFNRGIFAVFICFIKMLFSIFYMACFYLFVFEIFDIDLRWQISFYSIVIILTFVLFPFIVFDVEDLKKEWKRTLLILNVSWIGGLMLMANLYAFNLMTIGIICLLYAKAWAGFSCLLIYLFIFKAGQMEDDDD